MGVEGLKQFQLTLNIFIKKKTGSALVCPFCDNSEAVYLSTCAVSFSVAFKAYMCGIDVFRRMSQVVGSL
jgi:hypothetical protein